MKTAVKAQWLLKKTITSKKKKSQIFSKDFTETGFAELSTPRSGKLIKWRRGDMIGEGAYAKVYQCINLSNGELLAVKHFIVCSI